MLARFKPKRGKWSPPPLEEVTGLLMVLFCVTAVSRAYDYATGVDGVAAAPNSTLAGVERAFPLGIWAAALATGAALVLLGMLGRWNAVVAIGSIVLALVYGGLTVGLAVESLSRPGFDGIRGATGLIPPAVWHAVMSTHALAQRKAQTRPEGGWCAGRTGRVDR